MVTEAEAEVARQVVEYCSHQVTNRMRGRIRHAVHADAELSDLDLAGNRRNAALIAVALEGSNPSVDRATLERHALILVEVVDSVLSLAARSSPDNAALIIEDFAVSAAHALLRPDRPA